MAEKCPLETGVEPLEGRESHLLVGWVGNGAKSFEIGDVYRKLCLKESRANEYQFAYQREERRGEGGEEQMRR